MAVNTQKTTTIIFVVYIYRVYIYPLLYSYKITDRNTNSYDNVYNTYDDVYNTFLTFIVHVIMSIAVTMADALENAAI